MEGVKSINWRRETLSDVGAMRELCGDIEREYWGVDNYNFSAREEIERYMNFFSCEMKGVESRWDKALAKGMCPNCVMHIVGVSESIDVALEYLVKIESKLAEM